MPVIDNLSKMTNMAPQLAYKIKRGPSSHSVSLCHPLKKRRLVICDSTSSLIHHPEVNSSQRIPLKPVNEEDISDNDLTNLNWLQDANLLQKFYSSVDISSKTDYLNSLGEMTMVGSGCKSVKPPISYSALIYMAIESSPTKAMMVRDIYRWITENYPYFATAPTGWKNTIRHTLSLRKCFKKMDKPNGASDTNCDSDSDKDSAEVKGGYWYVDEHYRDLLQQQVTRASLNMLPKWSNFFKPERIIAIRSPGVYTMLNDDKNLILLPKKRLKHVPLISKACQTPYLAVGSIDTAGSTHPLAKSSGCIRLRNSLSVISVNQAPKVFAPLPKARLPFNSSPGKGNFNWPIQLRVKWNINASEGPDHLATGGSKPHNDARGSMEKKDEKVKWNNTNEKSRQVSTNQNVLGQPGMVVNGRQPTKVNVARSYRSARTGLDSRSGDQTHHYSLHENEDESLRDGAQALLHFAANGFHLSRLIPIQDY